MKPDHSAVILGIIAAFILLMVWLVVTRSPDALAAPRAEEKIAFFAQQRKEQADFDLSVQAETDSRTAAIREHDAKAQADRAGFTRALLQVPEPERSQRLAGFNAAALQDRKAFRAALPGLSKSKTEQALEDFDRKAAADDRAFIESLSETDPLARAEALRRFRNDVRQRRARLLNESRDDTLKRKRQFDSAQAQKARAFMES